VELLTFECLERCFRSITFDDVMLLSGEAADDQAAQVGVVLDDQNS
jgi:hypothetical protein